MLFPTTTVTILKKRLSEDEFGDEADAYYVKHKNVPAHLYEVSGTQGHTAWEPGEGQENTMETPIALIPAHYQVLKGDRLKDDKTGDIYYVNYVWTERNFVIAKPQSLELKIVK